MSSSKRKRSGTVTEEIPSTSIEFNVLESQPPDNLTESPSQRRSGRSRSKVSWRKSGGTIEKVVIKEEPNVGDGELDQQVLKRQKKTEVKSELSLKEQHGDDAQIIEAFIEKYKKRMKEEKNSFTADDIEVTVESIEESTETVEENIGVEEEHSEENIEEEIIAEEGEVLALPAETESEEFVLVMMEPGEGLEESKTEELIERAENSMEKELAVGEVLDLVTVSAETGSPSKDVEVTVNRKRRRQSAAKATCNMCMKQVLADNLDRHKEYQCRANPMRTTLLKCPSCFFVTECQKKLTEHRAIHPRNFVPKKGKNCVCEVCGVELTSAKSKVHHEWKQHEYFGKRISYECSICGKKYPSKWLHNEHMGYHLNRRNFVCDTCGKKFRSKQELKDHSKYAHIAEQFPHQCAHCRVGIRTEPEMKSHECKMVAELIQDKGFRGVNCVVYLEIIDDEIEKEGNGSVVIVDKVTDKLGDGDEEDEGTDDVGGPKLECTGIQVNVKREDNQSRQPRIFFDLSSIAEHHSGPIKVAERYMCEYCGDLFTTKSMKFAHRRIEHGYRKLPLELRQARPECEICGKKFVYRDSLKKHYLHTHSDERKHECPTCGKTFKRHADKEYHVNTMHMNIYKYFCNICGHGVHRKQYLKNHQCTRTHRRKHPAGRQSTSASHEAQTPPPIVIQMPATEDTQPQKSGLDFLHQAGAHLEAEQRREDAHTLMDTEALANILAKTDGDDENKRWVIQSSSDGQQILVIEDELMDVVQNGLEILVDSDVGEVQEIH